MWPWKIFVTFPPVNIFTLLQASTKQITSVSVFIKLALSNKTKMQKPLLCGYKHKGVKQLPTPRYVFIQSKMLLNNQRREKQNKQNQPTNKKQTNKKNPKPKLPVIFHVKS